MRLRAITTFFLNRIKDRATNHAGVGQLVEKEVMYHKTQAVNNERTMKMATEVDKIEIS